MQKQKRTVRIIFIAVLALVLCLTFFACKEKEKPITPPVVEFSVSFEGGEGATGTAPQTITASPDESIILPENTFIKEHFTFVGWSYGASALSAGDSFAVPYKNVVFTAIWAEQEKFIFTYSLGEGITGAAPPSKGYYDGDTVELSDGDYVKYNYTFVGWSDGVKNYEPNEKVKADKNRDFVALWAKNEGTEGLQYKRLANGTYSVTVYLGNSPEVTIPDANHGRKITEIGDGAFSAQSEIITGIEMTDNITKIGAYAFDGCGGLTELRLSQNLTYIGDYALRGMIMKYLTIPSSVQYIGEQAFVGTSSNDGRSDTLVIFENISNFADFHSDWRHFNVIAYLNGAQSEEVKRVTFNYNATATPPQIVGYDLVIGMKIMLPDSFEPSPVGYTFIGWDKEKTEYNIGDWFTVTDNVTFEPRYKQNEGTVGLGYGNNENLFGVTDYQGSSLSVEIPPVYVGKPVEAIYELAFFELSVETVSIPASVKYIAGGAFMNCPQLKTIRIDSDNRYYTVVNNNIIRKEDNCLVYATNINGIPETVTKYELGSINFSGITEFTLGSKVTELTPGFLNEGSITTLSVADGNTVYYGKNNCILELGTNKIVAGCKSSVIPDNVTEIGIGAFIGVTFTQIKIGANINIIGDSAFGNCVALEKIIIDSRSIANAVEGNSELFNNEQTTTVYVNSNINIDASATLLVNFVDSGSKETIDDGVLYNKYIRKTP